MGVDEVPEHKGKRKILYSKEQDFHAGKIKSSLSRLVELLQQANERVEQRKDSVQYWSRKCHSLYQEHMALKVRGPVRKVSDYQRHHTTRRHYYCVYELQSK